MKLVDEKAFRGIQTSTREEEKLRMQIIIGSYRDEIREKKYMVCAKYSNHTNKPCQRCHVLVEDLKNISKAEERTVEETSNSIIYQMLW